MKKKGASRFLVASRNHLVGYSRLIKGIELPQVEEKKWVWTKIRKKPGRGGSVRWKRADDEKSQIREIISWRGGFPWSPYGGGGRGIQALYRVRWKKETWSLVRSKLLSFLFFLSFSIFGIASPLGFLLWIVRSDETLDQFRKFPF